MKETLKESLEVTHYKRRSMRSIIMTLLAGLYVFFVNSSDENAPKVVLIVVGIMLSQIALYYMICVLPIFRKADHYVLCQCKLEEPHGWGRAHYFTVWLEDAEGKKHPFNTRPIFRNRGFVPPLLEYYINATVTIAYNEATGRVVVIG